MGRDEEILEDSLLIQSKERKTMQDDYSCQILPPKSDQADFKLADMIDTEEENAESASSVATAKLRSVMTQREMEIVTSFSRKPQRRWPAS